MAKLIQNCELINLMTRRHATLLPTTYARGHRCLDYAYGTELVANAVTKAGYEPFNSRLPTDHRAYFIDLSMSILFDIQLQPLAKHEPRVLQSANVNQVTAYIEKNMNTFASIMFSNASSASINLAIDTDLQNL
jgi:hypothetical protein